MPLMRLCLVRSILLVFHPLQLGGHVGLLLLHSLGEMDGGIRNIGGKNYVIFGVDSMVKYHGKGNEKAFFDHELFHTYHVPKMAECQSQGAWPSLWLEGLAAYTSHVLNPETNEQELGFEVPVNMAQRTREVLPAALEQLENVLDKTDDQTYAGLFMRRGDGSSLPARRGYYLGYLVAQEAAKSRDIRELAKLDCGQVKPLVFATVRELRSNAR